MPWQQLDNPLGAFGYGGGAISTATMPPLGGDESQVIVLRNASTVEVIPRGAAVIYSTLSSNMDWGTITTVAGSPLFAGVALTSAGLNTQLTTVTTAAGLGGIGTDFFQVQVRGRFFGALLTTGTVAGDMVGTVNSTVAGSTGGGYLGTIVSTQTAGNFFGVAGVAFTSGTTGTSGYLTATGPRGAVLLRPSIIVGSTL